MDPSDHTLVDIHRRREISREHMTKTSDRRYLKVTSHTSPPAMAFLASKDHRLEATFVIAAEKEVRTLQRF